MIYVQVSHSLEVIYVLILVTQNKKASSVYIERGK